MFTPTRDEARRFLIDAWTKRKGGNAMSSLETTAADIIALHPEYVPVLEDPELHFDRDYRPESGDVNPFLHLALHLAVAEQLSIDQPAGLRAHFERLRGTRGNEHAALHAVLECLGETVWRSQRESAPPDAQAYLECIRSKPRAA